MEDNNYNEFISEALPNQEAAFGMMDKLLDVAKPEAVYSEPVTTDGVTIITASEYMGGLGMGFGGGVGPNMGEDNSVDSQPAGGGGGGGAGGGIASRPVAAIIIEGGRVASNRSSMSPKFQLLSLLLLERCGWHGVKCVALVVNNILTQRRGGAERFF